MYKCLKNLSLKLTAVWKWIANDDTCGICRMPFDSCCTDCKYPGDDCPLVWGDYDYLWLYNPSLNWVSNKKNFCLPICLFSYTVNYSVFFSIFYCPCNSLLCIFPWLTWTSCNLSTAYLNAFRPFCKFIFKCFSVSFD